MFPFWDTFIEPILGRLDPRVIVEVGSERGKTTEKLLRWIERTGAALHAIDPSPQFDAADWAGRYGGRAVLHRAKGLDVLSTLAGVDAVLFDGDHNWYTVYHELRQIDEASARADHAFPLVLLHDVGWPYGRRDQYYDPGAIPEEYRQDHARRGMRPGQSALLERGGFNWAYWNATHEGGPRNGVMTAVEDFMKEAERECALLTLPGFHGLAVLAPRARTEGNDALSGFLRTLDLPPALRRHLDALEAERIDGAIRALKDQRAPGRLGGMRRWVSGLSHTLRRAAPADG